MAGDGSVVVVGGTRAMGLEIVRHYVAAGRDVVLDRADARERGAGTPPWPRWAGTRGITFDLAQPDTIAGALADIGPVQRLALVRSIATTTAPPTTASSVRSGS